MRLQSAILIVSWSLQIFRCSQVCEAEWRPFSELDECFGGKSNGRLQWCRGRVRTEWRVQLRLQEEHDDIQQACEVTKHSNCLFSFTNYLYCCQITAGIFLFYSSPNYKLSIIIIILLKSVCLSVAVRKLQVAMLARSSQEISQTVGIDGMDRMDYWLCVSLCLCVSGFSR